MVTKTAISLWPQISKQQKIGTDSWTQKSFLNRTCIGNFTKAHFPQINLCPWCAWQRVDHPDGDAEEVLQVPDQHLPGQPRLHGPPPHPRLYSHQGDDRLDLKPLKFDSVKSPKVFCKTVQYSGQYCSHNITLFIKL